MKVLKKNKVLILYTELGGYTLACLKLLAAKGVEVHVVHFPVNKEAPFLFSNEPGLTFYVSTQFERKELLALALEIEPLLVICSGWVNKDYMAVCRKLKGKATLTISIDNQWRGTAKQYLGMLGSRFSFLRIFDYAWVPGERQVKYVKKMGFTSQQIHTGFYCCDTSLYSGYYEAALPVKKQTFPRRFLYVGRYFDYKGVGDLWAAFKNLQEEEPNEWELWCVGMGDLTPIVHPKIKHFGFVQPPEMAEIIKGAGVFIMPSRFDQWGVALQEFSIAGFPLICSDRVGASEAFLDDTVNGFGFAGENIRDLTGAMKKIIGMNSDALKVMAERSHLKGLSITPDTWERTLLSMVKQIQ
jgi:glycosyltransferase involved in cell wall biosynthesis